MTIDWPTTELLTTGTSKVSGSVTLEVIVSVWLYGGVEGTCLKDAHVPFIPPEFGSDHQPGAFEVR